MAARMAQAARDRAIFLTPRIDQWPDAIGVGSTATIVSHYPRRGDYRVHAAACTGPDAAVTTYTHTLVKGARERAGEDAACALLTLRALADAAGLEESEGAGALVTCGVRLEDTPATNAVGEAASGIEQVPMRIERPMQRLDDAAPLAPPRVLVPRHSNGDHAEVPLPTDGNLPPGTLFVPYDHQRHEHDGDHGSSSEHLRMTMRAASEALSAVGGQGDGGDGAWSQPQAAVLLEAPTQASALASLQSATEHAAAEHVTNWGVVTPCAWPHGATILLSPASAQELFESLSGSVAQMMALMRRECKLLVARSGGGSSGGEGSGSSGDEAEAAARASAASLPPELQSHLLFVSDVFYQGEVAGLSDGSPSTEGVDGAYTGGWDYAHQRPEGRGVMSWSNGVTYDGLWRAGKYHGLGAKIYSRGGGYRGMWRGGRRDGFGTSYYDGKWGYDRWVGNFVDDKPHGNGTMFDEKGHSKPFEFRHGEPVAAPNE